MRYINYNFYWMIGSVKLNHSDFIQGKQPNYEYGFRSRDAYERCKTKLKRHENIRLAQFIGYNLTYLRL